MIAMHAPNQFSDFDNSLLDFARLTTIVFKVSGSAVRFRPVNDEFLGWTKENISRLTLQQHFLDVNGLTIEAFLASFQKGRINDHYLWATASGGHSQPLSTLWHALTDQEGHQLLVAVINYHDVSDGLMSNSEAKKYYYQAFHLPGFIHNLSGPLGTLTGRTELLRYKYPEIRDLEVMINTARDLRSMLQNFNRKISSEMLSAEIQVNLNRFLHEELQFLRSDQFFKHQVTKEENLSNTVPEFPIRYFSLSCLIMELYYFFRQFTDDQAKYTCKVNSFHKDRQIGFQFILEGDFLTTGKLGTALPFVCTCNYRRLSQLKQTSLDVELLRQCLKYHKGELQLDCQPGRLTFIYQFPLPIS